MENHLSGEKGMTPVETHGHLTPLIEHTDEKILWDANITLSNIYPLRTHNTHYTQNTGGNTGDHLRIPVKTCDYLRTPKNTRRYLITMKTDTVTTKLIEMHRDIKWICRTLTEMKETDADFETRIRRLEGWQAEQIGSEKRMGGVCAGLSGIVAGAVAWLVQLMG